MTHFSTNYFSYQGLPIRRQPDSDLVCLTDLWKAQGSPNERRPLDWVHLETTQALLKRLAEPTEPVLEPEKHPSEEIVTEIPELLETTIEGREPLTYATTELAVAYARFLSVDCYEWALANLVEESEEVANYLEQVEARAKAKRQREISRRALIAAGWAIPIILSVGMPLQVQGAFSLHIKTT
jgi:hypothetical protein